MFVEFVNDHFEDNKRSFAVRAFIKAGDKTEVKLDIDPAEAKAFLRNMTPEYLVLPVAYEDFKAAARKAPGVVSSYNVGTQKITLG